VVLRILLYQSTNFDHGSSQLTCTKHSFIICSAYFLPIFVILDDNILVVCRTSDGLAFTSLNAFSSWKEWQKLGDPVLHIDLHDWADLLVIAPLSAHNLAKFSHGFRDDTVSCVVRTWDLGHLSRPGTPLLLAPALNTAIWQHPLTQLKLSTIQGF
jgi:hypothetical protein